MASDPDLPPATPLTSPVIDAEGRLTYVGTDGRRYVVLGPEDQEAYRQRSLHQSLEQGARQLDQIQRQARIWLDLVCGPGLQRAEALVLLLRTLEDSLGGADEADSPPV
ncbi:MAG: hypothetical protein ACKOCM_05120 [Cyanobacteriota bacterium]